MGKVSKWKRLISFAKDLAIQQQATGNREDLAHLSSIMKRLQTLHEMQPSNLHRARKVIRAFRNLFEGGYKSNLLTSINKHAIENRRMEGYQAFHKLFD
jgi:hypothetical protein